MADESRIEEIYPNRFNHNRYTVTLAGFANNIPQTVKVIIFMFNPNNSIIVTRDAKPTLFYMLYQS